MGNSQPTQRPANDPFFAALATESKDEAKAPQEFTAIVGGSTGATGRWVVKELAENPRCTRVVALSRKEIPDQMAAFGITSQKIVVQTIDFAKLVATPDLSAQGVQAADVAFCCMGSSPASEEADFVIPRAFAQACSALKVSRMGLISSTGADANSMMFYFKLIGRREVAFEEQKFPHLAIFRPGMLDRQDLARFKEKWVPISKLCTTDLARYAVLSLLSQQAPRVVHEAAAITSVVSDIRFKPRPASHTV